MYSLSGMKTEHLLCLCLILEIYRKEEIIQWV